MIHARTIGGVEYTWTEPATARDVLEWEVRCQSVDAEASPRAYVQRAAAWAARFVHDATEVNLYELGAEDAEGMLTLFTLCNAVAQSAALPDAFVEGLRTLWARDADVEDVKPDPWCDCPRCTKTNPDAPIEVCKFRGIPGRVLTCSSKLMGIDEAGAMLSQPYWYLQIQAERARIRNRKATADAQAETQKKADVATNLSGWDAANPGWRQMKRASTRRS